MDEELSLRDIADILGQYKVLLIGLPLALAILAFAVASTLPRTYTSSTVVALTNTLNTQSTNLTSSTDVDPALLPTAVALTSGYTLAAPQRLARLWHTTPLKVQHAFNAEYNKDGNAITLQAKGDTAEQAQQRAGQALDDFVAYANRVVTDVIAESYRSRIQQAQLSLSSTEMTLRKLRTSLANTPPVLAGRGQSSGRENVAAEGVDPRFAGSSDQPANPAYSLIAVRIAELQVSAANLQALIARLEEPLKDPQQLLALARQSTQISRLADASLPIQPDGLGRGVLAVLGLLLGALLALLIAFVHHALRRPAAAQTKREPIAQHGD